MHCSALFKRHTVKFTSSMHVTGFVSQGKFALWDIVLKSKRFVCFLGLGLLHLCGTNSTVYVVKPQYNKPLYQKTLLYTCNVKNILPGFVQSQQLLKMYGNL